MNFIELYVIFFLIALLLLVVEVMMGMTLGIALAGSLAFFTLAFLELIGVLKGLNSYLITGSIVFIVYLILVVLKILQHLNSFFSLKVEVVPCFVP